MKRYLDTYEVYELAQELHANQRTKKDKRYFGHLWKVAEFAKIIWQKEKGYEQGISLELLTQTAYLHDSVEDQVKVEFLQAKQINPIVVNSVLLLTKKEGQNYLEYIWDIKDDPYANIVKRADLQHNSQLSRLTFEGNLNKLIEKHVKYMKAYLYLSGEIDASSL